MRSGIFLSLGKYMDTFGSWDGPTNFKSGGPAPRDHAWVSQFSRTHLFAPSPVVIDIFDSRPLQVFWRQLNATFVWPMRRHVSRSLLFGDIRIDFLNYLLTCLQLYCRYRMLDSRWLQLLASAAGDVQSNDVWHGVINLPYASLWIFPRGSCLLPAYATLIAEWARYCLRSGRVSVVFVGAQATSEPRRHTVRNINLYEYFIYSP